MTFRETLEEIGTETKTLRRLVDQLAQADGHLALANQAREAICMAMYDVKARLRELQLALEGLA
jgi:L-alanine-DL-glutamate epimerase-like enolase superfamily enzyme